MTFNIVNLKQGSPEWKAYRAQHFNASDAPAMMACTPNKSRGELVKELASGIEREFSDFVQERILDKGHEFEALCRPLAEQEMGETLYPVVGNNGLYSASFDGLDLMESQAWEHKRLNAALREAMYEGSTGADLPLMYQVQMEHQAMACPTVERVLFSASDWDRHGNLIEIRHCWYTPNPELRAQIVAGWDLIEKDVAAYDPNAEAAPEVVGQAPDQLPALRIDVQGMVTASNLDGFKAVALRTIGGIKTKLVTDQDFADADKTVKWCGNVESSLAAAKKHALSQTESIAHLFQTIDEISEQTRTVRLKLEKLVESEKKARKEQIVVNAQRSLDEHIASLNTDLGARYLASPGAVFAPVVKGLKSLDSMTDKVQAELGSQQAFANAAAARYKANREHLKQADGDWINLFPDFAVAGNKAAEDFQALAALRIGNSRQAEAARQEQQRAKIRAEEAAKLAEQQAEETKMRLSQIEGIRQQVFIASIGRPGVRKGGTIECIRDTLAETEKWPIEQVEFGAMIEMAQAAKDDALAQIRALLQTAEAAALREQLIEAEKDAQAGIAEARETESLPAPLLDALSDAAEFVRNEAVATIDANQVINAAKSGAAPVDAGETMTLGQINTLIAPIKVDAAGLAELGFTPSATVKAAKHFRASDVPRILAAMVRHLQSIVVTA